VPIGLALIDVRDDIVPISLALIVYKRSGLDIGSTKDIMQGKLFQKCTHLLYCSVLSLGGNVNTRRMS